MKVSVIIPTFNEENYLRETLERLVNQSVPRTKYEIVVVDNKSTDKTVKIARKYADKVVVSSKRESIARLRNVGAKLSQGNILAFIDADVLVDRGFISKVISFEGDYGVPNVKIGNLRFINLLNSFYGLFSGGLNLTMGCCIVFKRSSFLLLNGFNDRLSCNEDLDIVLRAKKKDYLFSLIDSKVIHNDRRFRKKGYVRSFAYSIKRLLNYLLWKKNEEEYDVVR